MFDEGGCTPHPSSDREPVEINNGLSFATDKVGSENLANSCICLRHVGLAWQFTGDASKSRAAARDFEFLQAKRLVQGWECAGQGQQGAAGGSRSGSGWRKVGKEQFPGCFLQALCLLLLAVFTRTRFSCEICVLNRA